jgi:hypothetical protein
MRCYNKWYWQQISMRAGLLKRHRARMMVNYYKRRAVGKIPFIP